MGKRTGDEEHDNDLFARGCWIVEVNGLLCHLSCKRYSFRLRLFVVNGFDVLETGTGDREKYLSLRRRVRLVMKAPRVPLNDIDFWRKFFQGGGGGHRTAEFFIERCDPCGRVLQAALLSLRHDVKLVYGSRTMTVNRRNPKGLILRISNGTYKDGERVFDMTPEVEQNLRRKISNLFTGHTIRIPAENNENCKRLIRAVTEVLKGFC